MLDLQQHQAEKAQGEGGRARPAMLSSTKRLRRELRSVQENPADPDIRLVCEEENIRVWHAWLRGPPGSPYEGHVFRLRIEAAGDYPLVPPSIAFVTRVFHPNVHFDKGEICLDILKKEWSPAWSLQAACRAVIALLSDPEADSPLNCDAGNMIRGGDVLAYETTARMYCVELAMTDFAEAEEFENR